MKKVWRLLLLFLALAALLAALVFLKDKPQEETAENNETKSIELLKVDKEKIQKVSVKSTKGNYDLKKSGDTWTIEGASFKIDQDAVDNILNSLTTITADRLIKENSSELEEYGLKEPEVIVTVELIDGRSKEIQLGNTSPSGESSYIKVKENNNVYLANSYAVSNF
jgi:hypothetical protein